MSRLPPPPPPPPPAPSGPTYPPPSLEGPVHGMAVASLVLSIVWLLGAGSILALIFGYKSKKEIDQAPAQHGGRVVALAGIVIGWIGVAGAILVTVLAFTVGSDPSDGFCDEDRFIQDPDC